MKKTSTAITALLLMAMTATANTTDSLPTSCNDTIETRIVPPYTNTVSPNARARMNRRVLVTGDGDNIRAFAPWKGKDTRTGEYANVANEYKNILGDNVTVWLMPIPTAAAFYSPINSTISTEEYSTITYMFSKAAANVRCVDVHTILGQHAAEAIYSRTDHHWSPLGAYYAAKKFASMAKVPFREISDTNSYQQKVIHKFCGSMYRYSGNINIKNHPDEFIYWIPTAVKYKTDFIKYRYQGPHRVTSEEGPIEEEYFKEYPDGSPMAYCTFLGGDARLTHVVTETKNGRRVLFIKDSYGNAIPGYLFYSFEELHVVDCRYFNKNIVEYIREMKVTDVVLCNNLEFTSSPNIQQAIRNYLTK